MLGNVETEHGAGVDGEVACLLVLVVIKETDAGEALSGVSAERGVEFGFALWLRIGRALG